MSMTFMEPAGGLTKSKLELANAEPAHVLEGKTFYSGEKELQTGTMKDNGSVALTVAPGGSVSIPAGYHDGGGKVTAESDEFIISIGLWEGGVGPYITYIYYKDGSYLFGNNKGVVSVSYANSAWHVYAQKKIMYNGKEVAKGTNFYNYGWGGVPGGANTGYYGSFMIRPCADDPWS